jgi:geranylgeranyl diphosphate synthase type II
MTSPFEAQLKTIIEQATVQTPPILSAALFHAVFPGGARVRPHLCLAVAAACGDDDSELSVAAAAALELLHCASLVHDDLPCFDDAATRRGLPSVHAAYGQAIAVLAGDGLIIHSYDVLTATASDPRRVTALVRALALASGVSGGIVAGQAWESEPSAPLQEYHRQKTGSLFRAATMMGAIAAGADPAPWQLVGDTLGEAYQVADDLTDAVGDSIAAGKPVGKDIALSRPSAVKSFGLAGTLRRFDALVDAATFAVPMCAGRDDLRALVEHIAARLVPHSLRSDVQQLAA